MQGRPNTARPAVAKGSYSKPVGGNAGNSATDLQRITGLFPTDRGNGFEVRVTAEILSALQSVPEGAYLKLFMNVSKTSGKEYASLCFKEVPVKAQQ